MTTGREAPAAIEIPAPAAPAGGSLSYRAELCQSLNAMIDAAHLRAIIEDRYDLAAKMSRLTGDSITKEMIDAWTATSKRSWRFPFEYAAAIEAACQCNDLQELLGRKRGTGVLTQEHRMLAELGAITSQMADLAECEREIKSRIKSERWLSERAKGNNKGERR